ncbi:MAG: hypothetical protein ACLFUB_06865 [Cyclobacteriaceae bacterium]
MNTLLTRKPWLAITIYSSLLALFTFAVKYLAPGLVHQGAFYILLFFYLLTLLTHYLSLSGLGYSVERFSVFFFTSMIMRLLLSAGVVLVALLLQIPERISFALNLVVLYFAFLIFEINALLTTLRSNFQKRA